MGLAMASHLSPISKFEIIKMGPGPGVRQLMNGGLDVTRTGTKQFGSSVPRNETQIAEMGPGAGPGVTDERTAVCNLVTFGQNWFHVVRLGHIWSIL